jgi:hypothetical protein
MRDWDARVRNHPGLILFVAVFLGGLPSLGAGFFMDDYGHYRSAREAEWNLKSLGSAYTIDVHDVHDGWIPEEMSHFRFSYFRPFSLFYFKLNIALWKDWKPGFHLMSLFVHFLAVYMLYVLGCRLLFEKKRALLAALLFAWFPQNIPAIPWISTSGELLVTFFSLFCVWSYLQFRCRGRRVYCILSLMCMTLGLLTKEYAVILPLLVLMAEILLYPDPVGGRRRWIRAVLRSLPFFVILSGYLVLRGVAMEGHYLPPSTRYFCPPLEPGCAAFALNKLLYGFLMVFCFFPAMEPPFSILLQHWPLTLLAAGFISALVVLVQRWAGWDREGVFALGWAVLFLLPTASFAPAPWHVYVPSAGGCILIVWFFTKGGKKRSATSPARRAGWLKGAGSFLFGLFFLVFFVFGFIVSWVNQQQMRVTESVSLELSQAPKARRLFFLDVKALRYNFIQELKMRSPHLPVEYHILSMVHLGAEPSRVDQLDDHRFLTAAQGRAFFLETGWGARRDHELVLSAGRTARVDDYLISIEEVGMLAGDSEPGAIQYVYHFEEPLRDPRNLFFQVLPDGIRRIEFR